MRDEGKKDRTCDTGKPGSNLGSIRLHWLAFVEPVGAGTAGAVSHITAISTYYPSCLSTERSRGHALAPGMLSGPSVASWRMGRQCWGRGGGGGVEGL